MADDRREADLPISWDEAREVVIVVLLVGAVIRLLGPLAGVIDARLGNVSDDLAFLTRNANGTTGLMLVGAGVLIATTPPTDVVPALRRATQIIAALVVVQAIVGMVIELTRVSGAGVLGRLETVLGRFAPGALFAGTARWLAGRVVPFDD